jgi:hypothetical protein
VALKIPSWTSYMLKLSIDISVKARLVRVRDVYMKTDQYVLMHIIIQVLCGKIEKSRACAF